MCDLRGSIVTREILSYICPKEDELGAMSARIKHSIHLESTTHTLTIQPLTQPLFGAMGARINHS